MRRHLSYMYSALVAVLVITAAACASSNPPAPTAHRRPHGPAASPQHPAASPNSRMSSLRSTMKSTAPSSIFNWTGPAPLAGSKDSTPRALPPASYGTSGATSSPTSTSSPPLRASRSPSTTASPPPPASWASTATATSPSSRWTSRRTSYFPSRWRPPRMSGWEGLWRPIGNPFGLAGTMTVGFVSALGRVLPVRSDSPQGGIYSIPDVIQTDASINPGNSAASSLTPRAGSSACRRPSSRLYRYRRALASPYLRPSSRKSCRC